MNRLDKSLLFSGIPTLDQPTGEEFMFYYFFFSISATQIDSRQFFRDSFWSSPTPSLSLCFFFSFSPSIFHAISLKVLCVGQSVSQSVSQSAIQSSCLVQSSPTKQVCLLARQMLLSSCCCCCCTYVSWPSMDAKAGVPREARDRTNRNLRTYVPMCV